MTPDSSAIATSRATAIDRSREAVNSDAPTIRLVLNTATEPRDGDAYGQRITLTSVRPNPVSTEPIPHDTYEVRLKVEGPR